MRIIIITQNAPMYLPAIMDDFLKKLKQTPHTLDSIVVLSAYLNSNVVREIKQRYDFYGLIDFIRMSCRIIKNYLFSLAGNYNITQNCYSINNVIKKYKLKKIELDSVNSQKFISYIKDHNIDLIISLAASKIFKKGILNAPRYGCINYHSALLPKNRGRQPLFWALLNGDSEVGVSIHEMDEKLDNGLIISQGRISVESDDSLEALYLRTGKIGPDLLLSALGKIDSDDKARMNNDASQATYNSFPTKKQAKLFRLEGKKFF